jgi:AAA domain
MRLRYLSGVEPIEPKFIERPLLQEAMFHLVAGKPGVGKGALCARWIARCTNGDMYGEPRRALWLSSEEDAARDLVPRLDVAGANLGLVALIPDEFKLPRDVDWLGERIRDEGEVGLLVIDPLSNHFEQTNSSVEEEVRNAIQPLSRLCESLSVPGLGIRHLSTKEGRGGFVARILGATGFVGVVRCVLGVAQDYDGTVHVRALKGNRVPTAESGRRFRLVGAAYRDWSMTVPKMEADGESKLDFDELVAMVNRQAVDANSEKARQILLDVLREHGGVMESSTLDNAVADKVGLTPKTIRNLRGEFYDRSWISYFVAAEGPPRVWNVALTNAAPFNLETPEAPIATTTPLLDNARAHVAPDGQLGTSDLQGDLLELPDTLRDRRSLAGVSGTSIPEVSGSSNTEVSGTSKVSGTSICPVCGSTKIGPISGRCHDCGSKVHEVDVG